MHYSAAHMPRQAASFVCHPRARLEKGAPIHSLILLFSLCLRSSFAGEAVSGCVRVRVRVRVCVRVCVCVHLKTALRFETLFELGPFLPVYLGPRIYR